MTITDTQYADFLAHFTKTRNIKSAAEFAGMSLKTAYNKINSDPAFAAAVKSTRRLPTAPAPKPAKPRIKKIIANEVWERVIELLPTYRYLSDVAIHLNIPYAAITRKMASDAEFCNQIMNMIEQPNWGKFERNPQ